MLPNGYVSATENITHSSAGIRADRERSVFTDVLDLSLHVFLGLYCGR
jgi:hypothetical protein